MSVAVAVDEPLDRQAHLFLGEAAHFEQPGLQLLELVLESAGRRVRSGHRASNRTCP